MSSRPRTNNIITRLVQRYYNWRLASQRRRNRALALDLLAINNTLAKLRASRSRRALKVLKRKALS